MFIVLALKSGSNAALPFAILSAPKTVVVHPGLVVGIFVANVKFGIVKRDIAKQIVPICLRLVIKLSVCVCVCVENRGFQRVDKFFVHFSSPLVCSFFVFCIFLCYQISKINKSEKSHKHRSNLFLHLESSQNNPTNYY